MRRLLNIRPSRGSRLALGLIPLIAVLILYIFASGARHAANAHDKLLPTFPQMAAAMKVMIAVDPVSGQSSFFADTVASLERLAAGLGIATLTALLLGLALGLLPLFRGFMGALITTIAVIPPMAILPILFIVFGLGETSKIALIVIGVTPVMVRDMARRVAAIPEEQIIKAQTLGASTWQTALRVALPQALPQLISCVRLALGPAWVFLISAEAIASDVGLGYRIFLVRRYLSMDIILPYVAWISLLAVLADLFLAQLSKRVFPWAHDARAE